MDAAALMQSAASVATEAAGAAPAVKVHRFHKHNAAALTLLSWVCKVGDFDLEQKKNIEMYNGTQRQQIQHHVAAH